MFKPMREREINVGGHLVPAPTTVADVVAGANAAYRWMAARRALEAKGQAPSAIERLAAIDDPGQADRIAAYDAQATMVRERLEASQVGMTDRGQRWAQQHRWKA